MPSSDMRAHRTRDAEDRWRCWLARHNLTEREMRTKGGGDGGTLVQHTPIKGETRTMGGGGGWHSTPPSKARRERQEVVVAGTARPHRTRDANDGRRWWVAHHTRIERETRTTGGGGGWHNTPASNARRERWVEVVVGAAHPHRTRDANDRRWWLVHHTPIECETQMMGGSGGWQSTPPSNVRRERWEEVVASKAYTHRWRDAHDRCWLHREMLRHHRRHPSMVQARPPLTSLPLPQLAHSPLSVPISLLRALWLRNSAVHLAGC